MNHNSDILTGEITKACAFLLSELILAGIFSLHHRKRSIISFSDSCRVRTSSKEGWPRPDSNPQPSHLTYLNNFRIISLV